MTLYERNHPRKTQCKSQKTNCYRVAVLRFVMSTMYLKQFRQMKKMMDQLRKGTFAEHSRIVQDDGTIIKLRCFEL